jgi:hypothetical protein
MSDETLREVYAALLCRRLTKPLQTAVRLIEAATGDRPRNTTELVAIATDVLGLPPEAVLDMTANELVAQLQRAAFAELLKAKQTAENPAPTPATDAPSLALLRVFTSGIVDERIRQATQTLVDDTLTANEKLTRIDELIHFPPTASAEQLGKMLGVSKPAVLKTAWWRKNRRGETQEEIDRRFDKHEERRGTPIDRRRVNRKEAPSEDGDDER